MPPGGILLTRVALALILFLVLLPQAVSASPPPYTPKAVLATKLTDEAFVTWIPGEETPDYYNVYGITSTGRHLLDTTDANADNLSALVPLGFRTYGVTAVEDGEESPLRLAVAGSGTGSPEGCIQIETYPEPDFSIRCLPVARAELMWNDSELMDSLI